MSTSVLQDLMRQVDELSTDEQLRLLVYLGDKIHKECPEDGNWLDLCGLAPYPLVGEDAQEWVTRTRRESTEHREALLRR